MPKKKKQQSSSSSSDSSSDDDEEPVRAKKELRTKKEEGSKKEKDGKKDGTKEEPEEPRRKEEPVSPEREAAPGRLPAKQELKGEDEDLENYKKRKIAQIESLGRGGGVYIPPFKMARLQKEIEDKTSPEYQRQAWEALRKSINGLVNKVNVSNIKNLVEELFQENLVRGRGLLARSIIRAQMASPGFTHVFAGLVAIINSKLPEIGDLIIRRIILQFRRAYKRNDKIVTTAAIKFMAHLVNQKVVSELLALHIATLLLERVTEDSIEVCVSFIQECGLALQDLSAGGSLAIFERFKTILHEGVIDRRVQYVIEGLFDTRRKKFLDNPAVVEQLDLVEDEDQVTHEVDLLDETIKGEETLNIFKPQDPEHYAAEEARWKQISDEILGLEADDEGSGSSDDSEEEEKEQQADQQASEKILDFTDTDLVNLRRQIYLVIMSSVHFEECVHKILKLNIAEGQEKEVCTMLIDCCAMERMFNRFYALQAERLCRINAAYQERFHEAFNVQFATVHRLETNKLRNIGKFFSHLLMTDGISWSIMSQVRITEETTTSSSRIFIKVIFQELSENLGIKRLQERLNEPELQQYFGGLFPKDHVKNARFAINYFTAVGLGVLTEDLREWEEKVPLQKGPAQGEAEESDSDSSDSSSSSSSSSS